MTTPDPERLQQLAKGWLRDQLSEEERREFENWLNTVSDTPQEILTSGAQTDEAFEAAFYQKIRQQARATSPRRLWPRLVAAASVLLALTAGGYFYIHKSTPVQTAQNQPQDIAPGKHTAALTLANGQRIVLAQAANGQIASQAGASISKTAEGQLVYESGQSNGQPVYNTLTTAIGETYKIKLPDGSLVWLNANSSLRYPAAFTGKERLVELTGEAYFEVEHNQQQPFRVSSAGQLVEDIGTHFNINSYTNEPGIQTTLIEGAIEVQANHQTRRLQPGQQAVNNGKTIQVIAADGESVTDWKDGAFYLDRMDFKVAMRKIARWYDVELIYEEGLPEDIQSGGWIPRDKPLSMVLQAIQASGQVHFRLEGRKLYVSK